MTHSAYAIYYLSCKKTARAKAFSAYCYFFACLDAITIPLYIYSMLFYAARPIDSRTVVSDNLNINFMLCYEIGMYCADSLSVLYLFSIAVSLYMGRVYRKIAAMPPDMNPLEDNLTSQHKRNKSSIMNTDPIPKNQGLIMFEPKKGLRLKSQPVSRQSAGSFVAAKFETSHPILDSFSSLGKSCEHQLAENSPYQMSYSEMKRSVGIAPNIKNMLENMDQSQHESNSNPWYSKDSLSRRHKYKRSVSPKKYPDQYAMLVHKNEPTNDYPNFKPNSLLSPNNMLNRYSVSSLASESESISNTDLSSIFSMDSVDIGDLSLEPSIKKTALRPRVDSPWYEDLSLSNPPLKKVRNGMRQLSSGHDYVLGEWNSRGMNGLKDLKGKNKSEKRGEDRLSGVRIRRFSGKLLF